MNKFNICDEVYFIEFHFYGVDILRGFIAGICLENAPFENNVTNDPRKTAIKYSIYRIYGQHFDDSTGCKTYDVGDDDRIGVIHNRVFKTYNEAFKHLNDYIQRKKNEHDCI